MWSPLDKGAFPSPEEIVYANKAINTLEDAIKEAFRLIESTKLRIAAMKRDLEERRWWIAPIRKVPTEILIDILLWASEMSARAPIWITAVCQLWRNLILATPKAWSFIDLIGCYYSHVELRVGNGYHGYFPGYTNTYFERSKPRLLHLGIPKAKGFYTKHSNLIIKEQAYRLQCLTTHADILSDTQSAHRCQQFPHLKTLKLMDGGAGSKLDTSFFNVSRFPALRTLRWPRCYPLTGASPTISPSNFPPLQNLSLRIGGIPSCMDILQSCAATLKTLHICYDECTTTTPPLRINFPLLQFLIIGGRHSRESRPLVDAATPALTSLVMGLNCSQIPAYFEADWRNVTHIRVDHHLQIPSACAQVRVLQMGVNPESTESKPGGYAARAKELEEIAGAYPSLETVELSSEGKGSVGEMQQKVEECFGEARLKPKLLWTTRWMISLPGHEPEDCGRGMPCVPPVVHDWLPDWSSLAYYQ